MFSSNTCICDYKRQILAKMKAAIKTSPTPENAWIELLLQHPDGDSSDPAICCLLLFLFNYGYCEECDTGLSEFARGVLKPLMQPDNADDE